MKKIVVFACFILCFSHLSAALQWSNKSRDRMTWFDAVRYCKNLNEGGYKDWRLPTAPQSRELVKNCPDWELGGTCNFTDDCIYLYGTDNGTCFNGCGNCPNSENIRSTSYYNKSGDADELWTSTIFDADSKGIEALTWWHSTRRFMEDDHLNEDLHYARCVRFTNSERNHYIKMSENEAERLYIEAKRAVSLFSGNEQCKKSIALLLKIMNSAEINGEQYEKAKELMLYAWAQLAMITEEKCKRELQSHQK